MYYKYLDVTMPKKSQKKAKSSAKPAAAWRATKTAKRTANSYKNRRRPPLRVTHPAPSPILYRPVADQHVMSSVGISNRHFKGVKSEKLNTVSEIVVSRRRRANTPPGKVTVRNRDGRPGRASRTSQSEWPGDTEQITNFTITHVI